MVSRSDEPRAQPDPEPGDPPWPPHFPHREIDALVRRLEAGHSGDLRDAHRLLALVAKETQRLRTTAARLSAGKLARADHQAKEIVADALDHADALRATGLSILNTRLDEADQLLATLREAFRVELNALDLAQSEEQPSGEDFDPGLDQPGSDQPGSDDSDGAP